MDDASSAQQAWTSTLSAAEMALIKQTGFEPCGTVMGTSVYRIGTSFAPGPIYYGAAVVAEGDTAYTPDTRSFPGYVAYYPPKYPPPTTAAGAWGFYPAVGTLGAWEAQKHTVPGGPYRSPGGPYRSPGGPYRSPGGPWTTGSEPWPRNWERRIYEDAMEKGAGRAVKRMVEQTRTLDAHGVVGTRMRHRPMPDMSRNTYEFNVMGTAVRRPGAPGLPLPFTSHLSGQDFYKLIVAGMVPVTLAVGVGSVTSNAARIWTNGADAHEIRPFGDAMEASVRIASQHLARSLSPGGYAVLGSEVSFEMEADAADTRIMTTIVSGTLVRRFAMDPADRESVAPLPIMRLSR